MIDERFLLLFRSWRWRVLMIGRVDSYGEPLTHKIVLEISSSTFSRHLMTLYIGQSRPLYRNYMPINIALSIFMVRYFDINVQLNDTLTNSSLMGLKMEKKLYNWDWNFRCKNARAPFLFPIHQYGNDVRDNDCNARLVDFKFKVWHLKQRFGTNWHSCEPFQLGIFIFFNSLE